MKTIQVLFLDDEDNVLNAIRRLFADESYGVAVARNTTEALDILSKEKIKVVLSDQRMPDMSGVQFLHRVKSQYPDIVRILFTAYADLAATEQAINISEVYRFINKPWNPNELKASVVGAMYHYDLVMENRYLLDEMRRKNAELEQANSRLKTLYEVQKEFSSTLSHELRTPLASIKAAIDIVLSQTPGPVNKEQKMFMGRAKDNIDRLNRLVNDILDLASLESGKVKLDFRLADLNMLIDTVVAGYEEVAKTKGLIMGKQLDTLLPMFHFDADKMTQVLSNLIGNAMKFTQSGSVTVTTQLLKDEQAVRVNVRDTGCGIKESDLNKLFEKFQQLGEAHTKVAGTGLGLAICKEIIRQHGGKIGVESRVGEGTTFYYIVPLSYRRDEHVNA